VTLKTGARAQNAQQTILRQAQCCNLIRPAVATDGAAAVIAAIVSALQLVRR
jgi:hypothetical protein